MKNMYTTKEEVAKIIEMDTKEMIDNLNKNLNWGVITYLKHKAKGKQFTPEEWKKLSNQEKARIKEQQRYESEIYSRNKQVCIPDQPSNLHTLIKTKNGEEVRRVQQRSKNKLVYNKKTGEAKIVFEDNSILEQGYQRIPDKTYGIAFNDGILDVDAINSRSFSTTWHDGRPFLDWYFSSTEDRYQTNNKKGYVRKLRSDSTDFDSFEDDLFSSLED